jgi:ribulose-phosphate 3-epimerase
MDGEVEDSGVHHRAIAGAEILLGVDGGVTLENIAEIGAAGADIIVTGSAVFDGKAPEENARFMLETLSRMHRPA